MSLDDGRKGIAVAVAMESNVGPAYQYLLGAQERIVELRDSFAFAFSRIYRTAPIDCDDNCDDYLNAVVTFETSLDPRTLLEELLEIENLAFRRRPYVNAPRTLDLDLLLYGQAIMPGEELLVPHPRLQQRCFVLAPLCDLSPEILHPVLKLSIRELYERLRQSREREQRTEVSALKFPTSRIEIGG